MMLIEEAMVPDAALPMAAFKAHLRLGTGFAEDSLQDPVLVSFLRAAMAAIEARCGKALITRDFSYSLHRWRSSVRVALPIAPVQSIARLVLVTASGAEQEVDAARYCLERDSQTPQVVAAQGFDAIPQAGRAVIHFTAGFGPAWDDLPPDLAQAVFLLAAHYYEYRDETALSRGCMPFGVQSLIERYRPVRLFTGGAT